MSLGLGIGLGFNAYLEQYLLDTYGTDLAGGWSLQKIHPTTTDVVRVRRSTDDAESNFTADEVSNGTLTTWVGAGNNGFVTRIKYQGPDKDGTVVYTSDFTSGNEDLTESNGTGTDGKTVAGVSDAYKFELTGGSATHSTAVTGITFIGKEMRVEFDYYIPNSNTSVDGFTVNNDPRGTTYFNTLNSWTSVSYTGIYSSNAFTFLARDGFNSTVNADGDVFYLKNIVITELAPDFIMETAASQPKIVDAGTLVTLNGYPAIESDGTDDYMQTAPGVLGTVTDLYAFTVGAFAQTGQASDAFWAVSDGGYGGANNWFILRQLSGNNNFRETHGTANEEVVNGASDTSQHLFTSIFDGGTSIKLGIDQSDATETATVGASVTPDQEIDLFAVDNSGTPTVHGAAKFQELIIYDGDKSADRAAIETEIAGRWGITLP